MTGITIGETHYDDIEDAMIDCDCGHRVLINRAEEIERKGKCLLICDPCMYGPDPGSDA